MAQTVRGRREGNRITAPVSACLAACGTEYATPIRDLQAAIVAARARISTAHARVVVELAFSGGLPR